jgi:lysozyme
MLTKAKVFPILFAAMAILLVLGLLYFGVIHFNNPSKRDYPVRGVDVSAYQGDIQWSTLSSTISFAFIKATEGSSYVDRCFQYNYDQARKEDILVGVYHFFSFESSGLSQAEHFIRTVGHLDGLPPVVDIEYYKGHTAKTIDHEAVSMELIVSSNTLKEYYGTAPVIYATEESFAAFVSGRFLDSPIWIRNVMTKPAIANREWTFWQFSNRHHLPGYKGKEYFLDMNVFSGSQAELFELATVKS